MFRFDEVVMNLDCHMVSLYWVLIAVPHIHMNDNNSMSIHCMRMLKPGYIQAVCGVVTFVAIYRLWLSKRVFCRESDLKHQGQPVSRYLDCTGCHDSSVGE